MMITSQQIWMSTENNLVPCLSDLVSRPSLIACLSEELGLVVVGDVGLGVGILMVILCVVVNFGCGDDDFMGWLCFSLSFSSDVGSW
jgi:hypothetical protein